MATPIEFTHDDCEFETADGLILGGPYLSIDVESDGDTFTIEGVRSQGFPQLGIPAGPAAVHVCDFIKQWAIDDLAKGDDSILRRRYEEEMGNEAQRHADDWADYLREERRMLAAE